MLRLGVISDLHLDYNAYRLQLAESDLTQAIARSLSELDLDALVIAGDIANGAKRSRELQQHLLDSLDPKVAANTRIIPGNHCLWTITGGWARQPVGRYVGRLLHPPLLALGTAQQSARPG